MIVYSGVAFDSVKSKIYISGFLSNENVVAAYNKSLSNIIAPATFLLTSVLLIFNASIKLVLLGIGAYL